MNYGSMRTWCVYIATLAGIGRLPCAPGTWATYCTLPCIYLMSLLSLSLYTQLLIIAALIIVSFFVIACALPFFAGESDPSAIVLDEFTGTFVTFIGVPFSWKALIVGFLMFRFFDIIKPFGIKRIERVGGAFGILADDIASGVYALILVHLYCWFFV